MCAKLFKLTVVTPDKCFFKDLPVLSVGAFGSEGYFTALPGHIPFLTDLKPGPVTYKDAENVVDTFFVSGGFVEVLPEEVTILADAAEKLHDLDAERAEKNLIKHQERLAEGRKRARLQEGDKTVKLTPEEEARIQRDKIDIVAEEAKVIREMARIKAARNRNKYPHKH
ncbi:MAG: ATP synthase F1 subunit epsilon [Deltaproteobacteria bacterium]|jgi:F-type H+-transporting ATPase subunit epsilon|nr:ATP synthase F1 subunit epsilon [Deltaproteobacteria bacterium]